MIYEDSEEEEDDIDRDIDDGVGISGEGLTDESVGQFGTSLLGSLSVKRILLRMLLKIP